MTNSSATKILVVEDDEVAAAFAQTALERAGYEVIIAVTGQEGLDIAVKDEDIALVVLDIMLPDITGFEVSARHKDRSRSRGHACRDVDGEDQ